MRAWSQVRFLPWHLYDRKQAKGVQKETLYGRALNEPLPVVRVELLLFLILLIAPDVGKLLFPSNKKWCPSISSRSGAHVTDSDRSVTSKGSSVMSEERKPLDSLERSESPIKGHELCYERAFFRWKGTSPALTEGYRGHLWSGIPFRLLQKRVITPKQNRSCMPEKRSFYLISLPA